MIGEDTLRQIQSTQQGQRSNALPIAVGNPPEFSNRQATAQEMIDRGFSIVSPWQEINPTEVDTSRPTKGLTSRLLHSLLMQVVEPRVFPSLQAVPELSSNTKRQQLTYIPTEEFPEITDDFGMPFYYDTPQDPNEIDALIENQRRIQRSTSQVAGSRFTLVTNDRSHGMATTIVSRFNATRGGWQYDPKIMRGSNSEQTVRTIEPTSDQIRALIEAGAKFGVRKVLAEIPPLK